MSANSPSARCATCVSPSPVPPAASGTAAQGACAGNEASAKGSGPAPTSGLCVYVDVWPVGGVGEVGGRCPVCRTLRDAGKKSHFFDELSSNIRMSSV